MYNRSVNTSRTNPDHAFSFFGRLLVVNIGCFLMSMLVFAVSTNVWLRAFIQLCDIVLVVGITYSFFYKIGDSDAVLVNSGHNAPHYMRGLIIGSIANIPLYVSAVLLILSRAGVFYSNFYNYFKVINSFFFPFLYTIMPIDTTILELHTGDLILAVLSVFAIPLISMMSYLVGLQRFSFAEKLFYRKARED